MSQILGREKRFILNRVKENLIEQKTSISLTRLTGIDSTFTVPSFLYLMFRERFCRQLSYNLAEKGKNTF